MIRKARALSTAAIVAFFAVALLPRATWALIDPDVWWHIRAGDEVLRTGRVPDADTWSLTASGAVDPGSTAAPARPEPRRAHRALDV